MAWEEDWDFVARKDWESRPALGRPDEDFVQHAKAACLAALPPQAPAEGDPAAGVVASFLEAREGWELAKAPTRSRFDLACDGLWIDWYEKVWAKDRWTILLRVSYGSGKAISGELRCEKVRMRDLSKEEIRAFNGEQGGPAQRTPEERPRPAPISLENAYVALFMVGLGLIIIGSLLPVSPEVSGPIHFFGLLSVLASFHWIR